jgi:hypothetical protein
LFRLSAQIFTGDAQNPTVEPSKFFAYDFKGWPVQFEITEQARSAIGEWLAAFDTRRGRYLTYFQAVFGSSRISRPGNTPASSIDGSSGLVLIVRPTARIRCAARKQLKFTGRPVTCVPCSCCSATPSWRAPFAIWGSSSTMRSRSRSRSSYSREVSTPLARQAAARQGSVVVCPTPVIPDGANERPRKCLFRAPSTRAVRIS